MASSRCRIGTAIAALPICKAEITPANIRISAAPQRVFMAATYLMVTEVQSCNRLKCDGDHSLLDGCRRQMSRTVDLRPIRDLNRIPVGETNAGRIVG